MNMQQQRVYGTRGFRIGVIAALAVVVMAVAAYWFGTGLRADTTQSVARSPLGSSLTAVRESRSEDYVGRLINSSSASRSASLAALANSRSNFYGDLNVAAAAAKWASVAAADRNWAIFYSALNSTNAAADAAANSRVASPAALDKGLMDQGIRPSAGSSSGMVESSAVDQYQNEWMGFSAPESVGAKSSPVDSYQNEWMGFSAP
jgi:hypothetical protein